MSLDARAGTYISLAWINTLSSQMTTQRTTAMGSVSVKSRDTSCPRYAAM
jgi:hypothetical protein